MIRHLLIGVVLALIWFGPEFRRSIVSSLRGIASFVEYNKVDKSYFPICYQELQGARLPCMDEKGIVHLSYESYKGQD